MDASEGSDDDFRDDTVEAGAAGTSAGGEPSVGFDDSALRAEVSRLAWPVLAEFTLTYCVGLFDVFLSGRLSPEATKAVGLAAYVSWLITLLLGVVSTGTTALVSRAWGAQDFSGARWVLNRSLTVAALLGVLLSVLLSLGAPWLAQLLHLSPEGQAVATRYLRLESIGYLFLGVTQVGAAALRGAGDTRTPMRILAVVNVVNIALAGTLVFGLGPIGPQGVDGIAVGSAGARGCGALLMLLALARGGQPLRLRLSEMTLWDDTVRRIVRIGVPALGESLTLWTGQFLFLMIIGRLPDPDALAAHMIGVRVEDIAYLPALAFGVASASIIGQSLGRRDVATALRVGHVAARQGALYAAFGALLFFFGADPIYRLMSDSDSVRVVGVPAFRWLALFQVPQAMMIVYVYGLRGAGDTRSPMWITLVGVYLVRVPLSYLGGLWLGGGLVGAWTGMFADVVVRAVLVWRRYSSGRWVKLEL